MIAATPAFLAANAKFNKVPVYLIQIQGYWRAFSNRQVVSFQQNSDTFQLIAATWDGSVRSSIWYCPQSAGGATTLRAPGQNGSIWVYELNGLIQLDAAGYTNESTTGMPFDGYGPELVGSGGTEFYVAVGTNNPGSQSISSPWTQDSLPGDLSVAGHLIGTGTQQPLFAREFAYDDWMISAAAFRCAGTIANISHITIGDAITIPATTTGNGIVAVFSESGPPTSVYDDATPITVYSYPWIIEDGIQDLQITVNDLDGGADLADLVFTVQDRGGAITGDFPSFVFEGKKVWLKAGYDGLDLSDFVTLFTGVIGTVESANGNNEYVFDCPDIRQELTKVIYTVGDDGFPTDSDHPRTLNGNPFDIFIAVLRNEVGLTNDDIDIATITNYRDTLFAGAQFEFRLTSPPAAKDFLEAEIMKPLGLFMWTNNLGQVTVTATYPKSLVPVAHFQHTNPADPDLDNLTEVPLAGQADLINQVSVRFDYSADDKPQVEVVRQDSPSIEKYGLFGQQIIEARGLRAGLQGSLMAAFTAALLALRYGMKPLTFGSNGINSSSDPVNALWSACLCEPGDIVTVTHPLVPDRARGVMGITDQTFVVMDRTWQFFQGLVQLKLLSIDLSKFQQFLITENSEGSYTAVSAADQAKYMFQSNDTDQYSNAAPGNTLA